MKEFIILFLHIFIGIDCNSQSYDEDIVKDEFTFVKTTHCIKIGTDLFECDSLSNYSFFNKKGQVESILYTGLIAFQSIGLIPSCHLSRCMAELFLNITFVDIGAACEAST